MKKWIGPCVIEGCERTDVQGKGMCQMHYYRTRRSGSPGEAERRQRAARATCLVSDCTKIDCGPHGYCSMHFGRIQRTGRLDKQPRQGLKDELHPKWLAPTELTYTAVHQRLRKFLGSARRYACVACGETAAQWAYDHLDRENEQPSEFGHYSPSLDHYQPMCVPCHKEMDLALLQGMRR